MTVPEYTLDRWKKQLEFNEQLLSSKAGRFHWLRKLYVRLYRFLVSRYGENVLPSDQEQSAYDDEGTRMPFVDLTFDHRGLQPRSSKSLRDFLQRIHSEQPKDVVNVTPSPLARIAYEYVVVATSQDYRLYVCESVLKLSQIPFRRRSRGPFTVLEVPFEQRDAAFKALSETPKKALRLSKRERSRMIRRGEFLIRVWVLIAVLILSAAISFFNQLMR